MLKRQTLLIAVCTMAVTFAVALTAAACHLKLGTAASAIAEKGYVTGKVTDSRGNPLQGVKVLIDHSIFYNSNISAGTDAAGNYRIKVPTGSWYAFAQLKKTYNGKAYSFYLEPDSYDGFGGAGAVRNFVWKLTGRKQEPLSPGFFGGTITFDKAIGGRIIEDENEIEFTLTPIGTLVDGSAGETLTIRSNDRYKLEDIPIGRYNISASYRGNKIGLRRWNTSEKYAAALQIDFEPQIPAQCDNCVKLEYSF